MQRRRPFESKVLSALSSIAPGRSDGFDPEVYPEFIHLRREVLPFTKKILTTITIVAIVVLLTIDLLEADGRFLVSSRLAQFSISRFWFATAS
ncbi:MAG: hypothetical protein MZU97_16720 [Bacillus subtilis]|nr:hypothetical protein [Bacillus subtilis]